MGEFVELARGLYLEGLAVDHAAGAVWYSDVIGGGIHRVAADGAVSAWNRDRLWTGGVLMAVDGRVLSSGERGILWTDPASGGNGWLVDGLPGVNEMVPDRRGGLIFGTVDLDAVIAGRAPRPAGIHRLGADGSVTPLLEDAGFVNGMMLSADGGTLFYNESFNGTFACAVRGDGSLGEPRMLLEKYDCDGMALDAEGNVWITGFASGHIVRIRPDGTPLAPFATPAGAITQCRFGGADARDLWLTAVPPEAADMLKEGRMPTEPASILYRTRSDIAGAALMPAEIRSV